MRLILMRHAKSSWTSGAPTDHARPLNNRGRRSAVAMGAYLARGSWRPGRVVLSDSVRTQETLQRMAMPDVEVELDAALYHGGPDEVRAAVGRQVHSGPLLVLGHAPGWSEAVAWLSGVEVDMKTADAVLLEGRESGSWASLVAESGRFVMVDHILGRWVLEEIVP